MRSWSSISVWNDPWLPTTRPRPANKNQHNYYPDLTMDSLIDSTSRTWNSHALQTFVDPHDVKIIESMPLSKTEMVDRDEWHLTNMCWWCFTYGSWKENGIFSGQGWFSTLEGFDGLMGARNVRASLSPLHAEVEALLWEMECMRNLRQFQVTFVTDCSQLVKMVSEPEEWPDFASYLEGLKVLKESFLRSEIIYIPRTQNTKADSLARSVRKQPSFVIHMDQDLPIWFTESVWVCISWCQRKKKE